MREGRVPNWEEYPHTPGVFVRVASKGVAGYGTWKSVPIMEGLTGEIEIEGTPTPGVFGQRVCNQFKTKEMIFDQCKRVRKNIKTKGIGIVEGKN
jgi:hypothetical protein